MTVLLDARDLSKAFPGVQALDGVSVRVDAGRLRALVGENGAGKSTLLKILGGAQAPDRGEMLLGGAPYRPREPRDAIDAGIAIIYQEDQLLPALSVTENVLLGRMPRRGVLVDWRAAERQAGELMRRVGADVDLAAPASTLGSAQRQLVEIGRALAVEARIVIMDEPTASLSDRETQRLFEVIAELKSSGVGILYVSHRLHELDVVADDITVVRDGRVVHDGPHGGLRRDELVGRIVGRPLDQYFPERVRAPGEVAFKVDGLSAPSGVRNVSFEVRAGEVLGIAGLVGSGRTELARAIVAADPRTAGSVRIGGRPVPATGPERAARAGLVLVPEERKTQGLVLGHSVVDNIALPSLSRLARFGWFRGRHARREAAEQVASLSVRTASLDTPAGQLSGGNQQKVVIGKWLARRPRVVVFDEPTKGIDIGAKTEVYRVINELVAGGAAVVLISSELPEVLAMADRILVMRSGAVAGIVEAAGATQESLFQLATGEEVPDAA